MTRKTYDPVVKQNIIEKMMKGGSPTQLAKEFGIKKELVYAWKYRQTREKNGSDEIVSFLKNKYNEKEKVLVKAQQDLKAIEGAIKTLKNIG